LRVNGETIDEVFKLIGFYTVAMLAGREQVVPHKFKLRVLRLGLHVIDGQAHGFVLADIAFAVTVTDKPIMNGRVIRPIAS
jgi:hypothetical protein